MKNPKLSISTNYNLSYLIQPVIYIIIIWYVTFRPVFNLIIGVSSQVNLINLANKIS